jgi:hypothetical protein
LVISCKVFTRVSINGKHRSKTGQAAEEFFSNDIFQKSTGLAEWALAGTGTGGRFYS